MSVYIQGIKPYYKDNDSALFLSDTFEALEKMKPECVDMIFADPPYFLSNGGITCSGGKAACVNKGKWDKSKGFDEDFEFHQNWINACKRVLKPNGTIWVSGTYHSIYACGFALQKTGFKILNDICWFKPNASPNMSCRYFTASHETFIFKSIDEKGNAECYFAYDSEDGFREGKYHFIGRATNCKPATKEQRDLLFQKMKEAGYEWDADKKELFHNQNQNG